MKQVKLLRYCVLVISLSLLTLTGCFNPPPQNSPTVPHTPDVPDVPANSVDSKRERFSEAGGTITLNDGSSVVIPQGFLDTSADITFYSSEAPPAVDPAKGFNVAAHQALGYTYTLELPQEAIRVSEEDNTPTLTLTVPAFKQYQTDKVSKLEILLEAGEQLFYFRSYCPIANCTEDDDEYAPKEGIERGTNTFAFSTRELRGGLKSADVVKLSVRPAEVPAVLEAQSVPTGFVLEDVITGLNLGVAFDFAKDGRIFIAEKRGVVKVFQNDALIATPFVDISAQVNNRSDRGLLGIAVHPDFPEQPYLYLLFTYDPPQTASYPSTSQGKMDGEGARVARLIRLTADANQGYNVAVPGSELVLLGKNSTFDNIANIEVRNGAQSCYKNSAYVQDCLPADETSHTIGTVRFGTDGALYVGNGDGANFTRVEAYSSRALDVNSLAGKIMKINPENGQGYADNPFYNGDLNSNASKVYSLGLRNPFRFTVNKTTNEPWIGDVGWGTWEEVNVGRGANFGWPCYEGGNKTNEKAGGYQGTTVCQTFYSSGPNLTSPAYGYYRSGVGSSIQVGDFYNGTAYPAEYRGGLFITDFNQQWIKYLTFNPDGSVNAVNNFATSEAGVVQTTAGPDTNLYLMRIYDGKLQRLRFTAAGNNTPVAKAEADPASGDVPLTVAFNSFGSFDADAQDLTYVWNFGNGVTSTEANPTYTFASNGVYTVTLKVSDSLGASNTTQLTIKAGSNPPVATITSPADGTLYRVGDLINFSGTGSDTEDGTLSGSSLKWDMRLHHNEHVHFDELPNTTGGSGSYLVTDHGDNTYLELCLIATDSSGQSDRKCINLYPRTLQVTLNSVPSGLQLSWDGTSRPTPFAVTTIAGSRHTLSAVETQNNVVFRNWSDGGARVHDVTLGTTAASFTASYSLPTAVCSGLVQEAETGAFFGDFTVGNDTVASGGKYVGVPEARGSYYSFNQDQRVEYCFNVTTGGTYRLKGRGYGPDGASDSLYLTVNGQPSLGHIWNFSRNANYQSGYLINAGTGSPLTFTLSVGTHRINIHNREDGSRLDTLELEYVPSESTTTGKLESVVINNVNSSAWTTVTLKNSYQRMVAVCTIKIQNNTLPQVVRMQNAVNNSFQIRLQNPSGSALVGEQVTCLVAETGNWQLPDGRAFEAQRFLATKEDRPYAWYGDRASYSRTYISPIVLGQVMTYNDVRWSTFWSHGPGDYSRAEPPTASGLYVGKHIGEDPAIDRADETLGFMVFEAGSGNLGGVPYSVGVGGETIWGYTNNPRGGSYALTPAFSVTPKVAVVTQMGMNGGDGAWASVRDVTPTTLSLMVDEDQLKDSERWASAEQVGYAVFGNDVNVSLTTPSVGAALASSSRLNASQTARSAFIPLPNINLDIVFIENQTNIFWSVRDISSITGFSVLRSTSSDFSSAQVISPHINVSEAGEYNFVDTSGNNHYYWLEVYKVGGSREVIGPERR